MFRKWLLGAAIAAGVVLSGAQAGVISHQFDGENGGTPALNYFGFANYVVSAGSVDLIGNGYFDWAYAGNGLYVDLAGTTRQFGALTTKAVYGPGTYLVTIGLGGPIYSGMSDGAVLSWGSGSKAWTLAGSNTETDSFLVTLTGRSAFTIADAGSSGNPDIGATLFDLTIDPVISALPLPAPAVPEPLSLAFLGAGLFGIVALRRRRKVAGTALATP